MAIKWVTLLSTGVATINMMTSIHPLELNVGRAKITEHKAAEDRLFKKLPSRA
jgi:hypothetical protein